MVRPQRPSGMDVRIVTDEAEGTQPSHIRCSRGSSSLTRPAGPAFGVWGGMGSLGVALGPVAGGALVAAAGWRSIFLVNVPICVLTSSCSAVCHRVAAEPGPPDRRSRPAPRGGRLPDRDRPGLGHRPGTPRAALTPHGQLARMSAARPVNADRCPSLSRSRAGTGRPKEIRRARAHSVTTACGGSTRHSDLSMDGSGWSSRPAGLCHDVCSPLGTSVMTRSAAGSTAPVSGARFPAASAPPRRRCQSR